MATPATQVQGPEPADHMLQVLTGYIKSSALHAVTKLGIPDLLASGGQAVSELARASKTNEEALYRALRALASEGVFTETSPRVFALTAEGECLCTGRLGTLRDMVLWWADAFHFKLYPEMLHSIKTGETVVEKVFGVSCFDYLAQDNEVSDEFNAAMTEFSKLVTPAVLEAYDFSWLDGKMLVDVGGGHGQVLTAILKQYPGVHGVIFDVDHVVKGARARVDDVGLTARCQVAGGDFFECVPGGDA